MTRRLRNPSRGTGRWSGAAGALTLISLIAAACSAPAPPVVTATVAARSLDIAAGTVTLPLHRGAMAGGELVWYALLDTSDAAAARELGLNWSAKLARAGGLAVREAVPDPDGRLQFASGTVDFKPERRVVPGGGDRPFPPQAAEPGSRGDEDYTPLFRNAATGQVFNAPVLAFGVEGVVLDGFCDGNPDHSLVHDKVVRICPRDGTVTLALTEGFSHGKPIVYVSTDASQSGVAALEGATYAPALASIESGLDDAPDSAVEPIFVVINGARGTDNAERQGLESALADGLAPLNIVGDIPGVGQGYSPLWDSHPLLWSGEAVAGGRRIRLHDGAQVAPLEGAGALSAPDGGPVAADGVIVNCPVIGHLGS